MKGKRDKTKKVSSVKPSDDVKNIIKLINLVPPDIDLPDADKIFNYFYDKKIEELKNSDPPIEFEVDVYTDVENYYHHGITIDTANDVINKIDDLGLNSSVLEDEIISLVSSIEKKEYTDFSAVDFMHCYKQFWEARIKVRHIAEFSSIISGNNYDLFQSKLYLFLTSSTVILSAEPSVTPDGRLTFQTDLVAKVFEGVKAERLKVCLYCDRVFWASRIDKSGCSTKCGQNIRTRKRRKTVKNRFPVRKEKKQVKKDYSDEFLDKLSKRENSHYRF